MSTASGKHKTPLVFVTSNPEESQSSFHELEKAGFEVNVVRDASNAVHLSEVKPKNWRPAFYIVDVVLPKMSGFELARRILSRYPDGKVPVLLISTHHSPEDALEARQSGALALLPKPVTWELVKEELEKHRQKKLSESTGLTPKVSY